MNKAASTTKIPFKTVIDQSLTSGQYAELLNPTALGDRVGAISESYQLWRINRLAYRFHCTPATSPNQNVAVGFEGAGIIDNQPTFSELTENVHSAVMNTGQTCPSNWVQVPTKVLRGALPWYKTEASGSVDQWEEIPGFIAVASDTSGSAGFLIEVKGEVEFKDPCDPANTPKLIEARKERMRKYILDVLATPAPAAPLMSSKVSPPTLGK